MSRRNYPGDLIIEGLSKRIGTIQALDNVSLNVARGEIVGLFGRDGAGKTICFEAIMGLVSIDSGRITLDGRDITRLTLDERGPLGISYLAQGNSIFGGMTTAENIAAVLEVTEPDEATRANRLEELLAEFNIAYVRDVPAPRLSGGERRRTEVARAMATSPAIMLLDEPFAGIDPMSVAALRSTIRKLRDLDIGVLLSDQNVREATRIIDRAYVMDRGRVIFEGSPDEMLADAEVHLRYLGDGFH